MLRLQQCLLSRREPQSAPTGSWRVYARISMVRQSSQPAQQWLEEQRGMTTESPALRTTAVSAAGPRSCVVGPHWGAGHNSEGPCASSDGHCTTCATLSTVPHDGNVAKDQVARLLKVPVQAQPGPDVLLGYTTTLLKSSLISNVRRACAFFFGCVRNGQLWFLQVCSDSVRRAKTSSSLGLCTIGSTVIWKPKFSGTTPKAGAARNAGVRKVKVRRESANDRPKSQPRPRNHGILPTTWRGRRRRAVATGPPAAPPPACDGIGSSPTNNSRPKRSATSQTDDLSSRSLKGQGLIPGGPSRGRAHLHLGTKMTHLRPGAEVVLELNLRALHRDGFHLEHRVNDYA